jgi:tellurite resistance protein TerC
MVTPATWVGFHIALFLLLALDLGVFHRRPHAVTLREAAVWSIVWLGVALAFNAGVYRFLGPERGIEFFTGYLIERSLSIDNILVFVLIFSYFAVPAEYHYRILFWGILGAVVFRGALIAAGALLLAKFHWVTYLFGALVLVSGVRFFFHRPGEIDPERNPVLRMARRLLPVTEGYVAENFLVRRGGRWLATPLLLVLLMIESSDVVFAMDSIPAIFAVTRSPFIVYTSNVFAILGLRASYFLLASLLPRLRYLTIGLAAVLVFIGLKMLGEHWVSVPTGVSLLVVALLLGATLGASLIAAPAAAPRTADRGAPPGRESP